MCDVMHGPTRQYMFFFFFFCYVNFLSFSLKFESFLLKFNLFLLNKVTRWFLVN